MELFPVPAVPPRSAAEEEGAEDEEEEQRPRTLFEVRERRERVQRVTASVRIDGERLLLGYSASQPFSLGRAVSHFAELIFLLARFTGSGLIRETRFIDLNHPSTSEEDTDAQLAGAITVLEIHEIEGRQVVLAGAVDGSAGAWELR